MSDAFPPDAPDAPDAPTPPSVFELHLEIETPERIEIRYDLAGIGSRFAAGTLDAIFLMLVYMILVLGILLGAGITFSQIQDNLQWVGFAAMGLIIATTWLYFIGFELLWNGQTPGKRWLQLRVVAESGGPAPAAALIVRNVLRVVDLAPFYVLGGIIMFINARSKRLGDMGAGTVVVQEREVAIDADRLSRGLAQRLGDGNLSGEDRALAQTFVKRLRELRAERRAAVARRIVDDIRERHELPDGDPIALLAALAEGRTPTELMDASGPRSAPAAPQPTPRETRDSDESAAPDDPVEPRA